MRHRQAIVNILPTDVIASGPGRCARDISAAGRSGLSQQLSRPWPRGVWLGLFLLLCVPPALAQQPQTLDCYDIPYCWSCVRSANGCGWSPTARCLPPSACQYTSDCANYCPTDPPRPATNPVYVAPPQPKPANPVYVAPATTSSTTARPSTQSTTSRTTQHVRETTQSTLSYEEEKKLRPAPAGTIRRNQNKYYTRWCRDERSEYNCRYLDDVGCQKIFPSDYDRDFQCPNMYDRFHLIGFSSTKKLAETRIDETTLPRIIGGTSPNLALTVILIRRDTSGQPYYKYYGLNPHKLYQPWSTSKVFTMINAASSQRKDCGDGFGTEHAYKHSLGDLSTIIHSYGSNGPGYESNCLSYYFLTIGGRHQLHDNVYKWLGASSNHSLGGGYGCWETYGLGYNFSFKPNGPVCRSKHLEQANYVNRLSSLAAAEWYKRIMMTREEPSHRYPQTEWGDVRSMLYGSHPSNMFPGIKWGGGSTDTAWYIQSGLSDSEMMAMDRNTEGRWRIFSKLGAGNEEISYNGYACFPEYEEVTHLFSHLLGKQPRMNKGVEFVIAVYGKSQRLCGTDQAIQKTIAAIVRQIKRYGRLDEKDAETPYVPPPLSQNHNDPPLIKPTHRRPYQPEILLAAAGVLVLCLIGYVSFKLVREYMHAGSIRSGQSPLRERLLPSGQGGDANQPSNELAASGHSYKPPPATSAYTANTAA